MGENGIIKRAKHAEVNFEEQAREKLEIILLDIRN